MVFSYRTRRVLSRIFPTLLTVLVLILAAVLCWLIWLQRFVVYTPQGVVFDFSLQPPSASGIRPQDPGRNDINIEYPDTPITWPSQGPVTPTDPTLPSIPDIPDIPDTPKPPATSGDTVLTGYYTDLKTIQEDPNGVRNQIERLPAGTAVMVTVANYWGYRYYTSAHGTPVSQENLAKMDGLLEWMAQQDYYMIARLPAFRDYYYSLDNTSLGLAKSNGYLWQDADRCYWLNPTKAKVQTRLTQIIRELKDLGFDEVVFEDFMIPDAEAIVFSGDRKEAVYEVAQILVEACATEDFAISFLTSDYGFRLPQGNCRLYLENVEPSAVQDVLDAIDTPDDRLQIVFFCGTFDSRFDGCSVLRPLDLAP